jgi:hypothetical protein
VFIDSKMGSVIKPAGWSTWSGQNELTTYYAEYSSMDLNGAPLDVSQRVSWSHQLTAEQAAAFSKENWLGGTDGWNPVIDAVAVLSGDYNNDGIVNAADYTVWRNNLGGDSLPFNETESLGIVDEADYAAWKSNFGEVAGTGSASALSIPEPSGVLITLVFILDFVRSRRFDGRQR